MQALIPVSSHVHLKNAERTAGKPEFLLPGDGPTDHVEMLRQLGQLAYEGYATVQVSARIH